MDDDGKTLPDFDQPTMAGLPDPASRPNPGSTKRVGVGAMTPPPDSAAPTLVDGSPLPPSSRALSRLDSDSGLNSIAILQPQTILGGRYRILRVLGEGGMGAVYQARDQELDRLIAVKVIRPELAGNPTILQRFKQELILSRNVTHKNVVRIFDLGEADGIKFITMEYVEGEDLRSLLRTQGKFSPEDAVEMIQQICRALDAAHATGVIHRDLKPQNVMRDPNGRIVVMDFGLARSLESPGMTQTGAMVGTLEYMSPEQAMGGELDQRSDLFAVGLIFYELLTGKVPYKADTAIASLMKRTQERAIPAAQVDATVPHPLSEIVSKCLERDPKHRYHSAHELERRLEAWKGHPNATPSVLERLAPDSAPRSVQISLNLPGRRTWIWAAIVLAMVMGFFAVPYTRNLIFPAGTQSGTGIQGIPELSKGKYVAVLPLKVIGDPKTLGYVAGGLVDALSAKMFQLQEVHVASSSAVEKVAQIEQPLTKTARDLGVNLILQGNIQGNADRLRVTFDLEDVAGGRRLWSKEFSGVPQDLLTLEDQIYGDLVAALDLKPSNEELARSGVHPTENTTAYDLYLKGRNALRGDQGTLDLQAAMEFFEGALKQDPSFALAYTGLADADLNTYRSTKDALYAQKALAAAQKAESINPGLPEVHLSLGSILSANGKSTEAVAELQQALKLAPNSDDAYERLGEAYLESGRPQDAVRSYESAIQSNPYYWANHNGLGQAYLKSGDKQKALQEFQRVTELASDNSIGFENIGAVYYDEGRYNDAIPAFEKALVLKPDPSIYSNLGTADFILKRYDDAVKMFEKAREMTPKDEALAGNLADAYRWSSKPEKAGPAYDTAISLAYQQLQVNPRSSGTLGDLAVYYGKKGDAAHAQQYIKQARALDASDSQLMYNQAQIFVLADRPVEALGALREAFKNGRSPEEAISDPEMKRLQGMPEFTQLVSQYSKKAN